MPRRWIFACALAAGIVLGPVGGQVPSPPVVSDAALPAAAPASRPPRLLPWFEFCTGSKEEGAQIIGLLSSMQEWTDGAIVVTQPGGEWIYVELARRLPYLSILPGARVVQIEPKRRLDDPARWEAVAAFVRSALGLTRARRFVLEVEYPLYGYWEGEKPLDLSGLAAGLRRLPPQVEYVWYPAGVAHWNQTFLRDSLPRCLALWRTIQASLPLVVFTNHGPANSPEHGARPWEQINDVLLRSEGRRTMDSVYVGSKPARMWPMSQAGEAVARVRTAEAFVWCPLEEWPALSAQLARAMPVRPSRSEGPDSGPGPAATP